MAVQHQQDTGGFAATLRRYRLAAGLSQEALAERAGLSPRTVSDLERGVKTRPHPATTRALADALGLETDARAALAAAARPEAAIPPPTATAVTAVPIPATALVGRATELATAMELLAEARLLTLTGPGGVGKTRLAIEIARASASDAVFVELGPVATPDLVLPAVAAALGVRETAGRPLAESVTAHLRSRRLLLVLDNCEHVLEGARPVVTELLDAAPDLRILATSRPPLRLRGERLLPLAPLPLPDPARATEAGSLATIPSVALFVERARDVRPGFTLTAANAGDIAAICARLDGLPLALELAAARLRALSPAALLALLSERLRLLTAGPEDAPARHQTLRAAIAWSHDQLTDGQQATFRRLAVAPGGCTLETAAALVGDDPLTTLDAIEALVDHGLLRRVDEPDGDVRFAMLETVREYALERLGESGEAAATAARHATRMLALAAETGQMLQGPEPRAWLDRLAREQGNIRAALAWALGEGNGEGDPVTALRLAAAMWQFWHMRGQFQEGHDWLERAIARGDRVEPVTRAAAYLRLASVANNLEDYRQAETLYADSLRIFEEAGNRDGIAAARVGLGMVATERGDHERAERLLRDELTALAGQGTSGAALPALYALGRLEVARERWDAARAAFADAGGRCAPGDIGTPAYLQLERARLERLAGDPGTARQLAETCLARFREIGERRAEGSTLTELGHLALLEGSTARASRLFREAGALHRELRDELGIVAVLEGLALVAADDRQAALAGTLVAAADAWRERSGSPRHPVEHRLLTGALGPIPAATVPISLDQALEAAIDLVTD
jgi:predicted ATPase/DNA-binding XRE family transcriptional regulator